jgi:hypothetical protein
MQFAQQQAQKAVQGSAAAQGNVLSGGAAKNLGAVETGIASQYYQQAFQNFQTATQNRYSNLLNVSNAGQNAANVQGQNTIGAATYGGNITENAAQFAGTQGLQAAEFAGTQGVQGAEFAGTAGMQGAQYAGTAAQNAAAQSGQWNIQGTETAAQNLINANTAAANYNTQGAAAQAAGVMGQANAWSNALGGLAGTASASQGLNLLKNPSFGYGNPTLTGSYAVDNGLVPSSSTINLGGNP